jgi:hypothetical protein
MIIEFIINKGVIVGLALLIGSYCFSLINLPIATIGFFLLICLGVLKCWAYELGSGMISGHVKKSPKEIKAKSTLIGTLLWYIKIVLFAR